MPFVFCHNLMAQKPGETANQSSLYGRRRKMYAFLGGGPKPFNDKSGKWWVLRVKKETFIK